MKNDVLSREDLIKLLKKHQGQRTAREFAKVLGITGAFISDIYAGKRDPGPTVLEQFGLRRVQMYERQKAV